jgi:4'-phosphopantetheinyl transferase EntD
VISSLLPDWVATCEAYHDASEDALFPAERDIITRAVQKRRSEFTTVRVCARAALAQLGIAPAPILPGLRGAPGWPDGVIGSMTHCDGYRAAAVALGSSGAGIGIDAEPHGPLPDGVIRLVARPEEHERLDALATGHPGVHWDRLLFSMKESVYKAWFPLTGRWLDFQEASITMRPEYGTFSAELLVPGPTVGGSELTAFQGRFVVSDGLVLSAITVGAGMG